MDGLLGDRVLDGPRKSRKQPFGKRELVLEEVTSKWPRLTILFCDGKSERRGSVPRAYGIVPTKDRGTRPYTAFWRGGLGLPGSYPGGCYPDVVRGKCLIYWRSLRDYSALRASPFGPPSAKPPAFQSPGRSICR